MAKKKTTKKKAAKKGKKAPKKTASKKTKKKAAPKKGKKAVKKTATKKGKKAPKKTASKKTKKKAAPKKAKKAVKKTAAKKAKKAPKKKAAPKKAKKAVKKTAAKKAKKAPKKKAAPKKAVKKAAPKAKQSTSAKTAPPKKRHIPQIARPTGTYGGVLICEDPKPFPKSSPYSKKEVTSLRQGLEAERDKLVRELASLAGMSMGETGGEPKQFATESSEYSADMQAAETIMGVRSLEEERLEQVVEALERITESSNYGLCLACGSKIAIDRLIAKPHAHLCMDCRRIYEVRRAKDM